MFIAKSRSPKLLKSRFRSPACADARGVKSGVVQDKLYLPGLRKLRMLKDAGFFGRMLAVRGEFGYWVFEGDLQPTQRPSWNYRKADGGGIILDMLPHWRYVLDNLFGAVKAVSCIGATHITERVDESGAPYKADADDAAYATFQLEGGVIAHINSSWAVRVKRDDLVTFQVDGTHGSAVAGLTRCYTQHRVNTPRPVWNPDIPQTMVFGRPMGRGARHPNLTKTVSNCSGKTLSVTWWRTSPGALTCSKEQRACSWRSWE